MKKLLSALVVSSVLGLSGALLLGEGEAGCDTSLATVFSDVDTACIAVDLAASVIPPGTPAATVAQDVADVCGLTEALLPDVTKVVTDFEGQAASAADAGTAPLFKATTYQQPAWALPKIQAARARRLSAAEDPGGTRRAPGAR